MGEAARKLEPGPQWRLVNSATGRSFSLRHGFRIGRAEGDLVLADDASVSSKHCVFRYNADDSLVLVEDVGSRNGTYLNGKKLEPKKAVPLAPGDKLEIGSSTFQFQGEEHASAKTLEEPVKFETPSLQLVSSPMQLGSSQPEKKSEEKPQWKKPTVVPLKPPLKGTKTNTETLSRPLGKPTPGPVVGADSLEQSPISCLVFIVLNSLVFLWQLSRGADLEKPDAAVLIALGGNINGLTTGGQWWRLLSSNFLHSGIMHIASNMFVLYFMGMPVARRMGTARFVPVYLWSGLIGAVAGLYSNPANVVSVGASGSVFGVVGGLLALQLLGQIDPRTVGKFGTVTTLNFIVRNLGLGVQGIDVAAHIGGLLAGFVLAYGLCANGAAHDQKRPLQASGAALGLLLLLSLFAPHAAMPGMMNTKFRQEISKIAAGMKEMQAGYQDAANNLKAGKISEAEFITRMKEKIIPFTEKFQKDFAPLEVKGEKEAAAKAAYAEILLIVHETMIEITALIETKDKAHEQKLEELEKRRGQASKNMEKALDELDGK